MKPPSKSRRGREKALTNRLPHPGGRPKGSALTTDKQLAVVSLKMANLSEREISRTLSLSRPAVHKVLTQSEFVEAIARSRSILDEQLPQMAAKLASLALRGQGDRQALTDILKGMGALTSKVTINERSVVSQ